MMIYLKTYASPAPLNYNCLTISTQKLKLQNDYFNNKQRSQLLPNADFNKDDKTEIANDYDGDVPVTLDTHFKIVEDITIQKEQNGNELNKTRGRDMKSVLKVTSSVANHSAAMLAVSDKPEKKNAQLSKN
ncbi:uncharacterized protein LOC119643580 isoform X2 [Glossina fuscipes]|uniref:Uncharacterized protein LOC119643580 isoform X2 n=1 Tax=Glossina fuscipes TaxID=7396 RepID=A0A9C5ZBY8_9MUSC|nr:uncharacterized protein LOC119643580 isoform X2 [Glossina fuscipes]